MLFIRCLFVDIKRMFLSWRYHACVLVIVGVIMLCVIPETGVMNMDVSVYYLFRSRGGIGAFLLAMSALCALPYGLSYLEDKEQGFLYMMQSRCGFTVYCWSHIFVTAAGVFFAVFEGYLICLLLLRLSLPMVDAQDISGLVYTFENSGRLDCLSELVFRGQVISYFIHTIGMEALGYVFLAEFSLVISAKVTNGFVVLSAPALLYFGSSFLCQTMDLPGVFRWYYVMDHGGIFLNKISDARVLSFVIFSYFSLLIMIEVVWFYILASKTQRGDR